jgi:hypothetical protein
MYYDKRFQLDYYFPMIAFNQEQIKANVTGSFIYSKRSKFASISNRIAHLDQSVLASVADRLSRGEFIKPETDTEKCCFSLLEDIDHVGAYTDGFLTSKKYMRNEIWSLISYKGAPNWFITFLQPTTSIHFVCTMLTRISGSLLTLDQQETETCWCSTILLLQPDFLTFL